MYPDKELEIRLIKSHQNIKILHNVYELLRIHSDILYSLHQANTKQWRLDNGGKIEPASSLPELEKKKLVLEYKSAVLIYNERQVAVSRAIERINNYLIDTVLDAVGTPEGDDNE